MTGETSQEQKGEDPVLSIVVPTKDRYQTLNILITTTLAWHGDAFELIVQDNSCDNGPIQLLLQRHADDSRFRYFYDPRPMSAPENCDAAVSRARGDIITFIGDDDGVSAHSILLAEWMRRHDIDAAIPSVATYIWPGTPHFAKINVKYNGRLMLPSFNGDVRFCDTKSVLTTVLAKGAGDISSLPRVYHGFVRRSRLDELRVRTGSYFPGPVPDMPNAVGLVPFLKRAVTVSVPLIISGQSAQSMSGLNAVRKHQSEIAANPALPADTAEKWDARVPFYWSGPNIWAEGVLKGAERTGQTDILDAFDFTWVYARDFVFNNFRYYPRIFRAMSSQGLFRFAVILPATLAKVALVYAQRARIFLGKLATSEVEGTYCATISAALDRIDNDESLTDAALQAFSRSPDFATSEN